MTPARNATQRKRKRNPAHHARKKKKQPYKLRDFQDSQPRQLLANVGSKDPIQLPPTARAPELEKLVWDNVNSYLTDTQRFRYDPVFGFQVEIPQTNSANWFKRTALAHLRKHLDMKEVWLVNGNRQSKRPPKEVHDDHDYSYWVAQAIFYGIKVTSSQQDIKVMMQKALRDGTLAMSNELRELRSKLKRQTLGTVSEDGVLTDSEDSVKEEVSDNDDVAGHTKRRKPFRPKNSINCERPQLYVDVSEDSESDDSSDVGNGQVCLMSGAVGDRAEVDEESSNGDASSDDDYRPRRRSRSIHSLLSSIAPSELDDLESTNSIDLNEDVLMQEGQAWTGLDDVGKPVRRKQRTLTHARSLAASQISVVVPVSSERRTKSPMFDSVEEPLSDDGIMLEADELSVLPGHVSDDSDDEDDDDNTFGQEGPLSYPELPSRGEGFAPTTNAHSYTDGWNLNTQFQTPPAVGDALRASSGPTSTFTDVSWDSPGLQLQSELTKYSSSPLRPKLPPVKPTTDSLELKPFDFTPKPHPQLGALVEIFRARLPKMDLPVSVMQSCIEKHDYNLDRALSDFPEGDCIPAPHNLVVNRPEKHKVSQNSVNISRPQSQFTSVKRADKRNADGATFATTATDGAQETSPWFLPRATQSKPDFSPKFGPKPQQIFNSSAIQPTFNIVPTFGKPAFADTASDTRLDPYHFDTSTRPRQKVRPAANSLKVTANDILDENVPSNIDFGSGSQTFLGKNNKFAHIQASIGFAHDSGVRLGRTQNPPDPRNARDVIEPLTKENLPEYASTARKGRPSSNNKKSASVHFLKEAEHVAVSKETTSNKGRYGFGINASSSNANASADSAESPNKKFKVRVPKWNSKKALTLLSEREKQSGSSTGNESSKGNIPAPSSVESGESKLSDPENALKGSTRTMNAIMTGETPVPTTGKDRLTWLKLDRRPPPSLGNPRHRQQRHSVAQVLASNQELLLTREDADSSLEVGDESRPSRLEDCDFDSGDATFRRVSRTESDKMKRFLRAEARRLHPDGPDPQGQYFDRKQKKGYIRPPLGSNGYGRGWSSTSSVPSSDPPAQESEPDSLELSLRRIERGCEEAGNAMAGSRDSEIAEVTGDKNTPVYSNGDPVTARQTQSLLQPRLESDEWDDKTPLSLSKGASKAVGSSKVAGEHPIESLGHLELGHATMELTSSKSLSRTGERKPKKTSKKQMELGGDPSKNELSGSAVVQASFVSPMRNSRLGQELQKWKRYGIFSRTTTEAEFENYRVQYGEDVVDQLMDVFYRQLRQLKGAGDLPRDANLRDLQRYRVEQGWFELPLSTANPQRRNPQHVKPTRAAVPIEEDNSDAVASPAPVVAPGNELNTEQEHKRKKSKKRARVEFEDESDRHLHNPAAANGVSHADHTRKFKAKKSKGKIKADETKVPALPTPAPESEELRDVEVEPGVKVTKKKKKRSKIPSPDPTPAPTNMDEDMFDGNGISPVIEADAAADPEGDAAIDEDARTQDTQLSVKQPSMSRKRKRLLRQGDVLRRVDELSDAEGGEEASDAKIKKKRKILSTPMGSKSPKPAPTCHTPLANRPTPDQPPAPMASKTTDTPAQTAIRRGISLLSQSPGFWSSQKSRRLGELLELLQKVKVEEECLLKKEDED